LAVSGNFRTTGQRRGDVVKMGHHNVRDGFLTIVQSKTGQEVPTPLYPALAALTGGLPRDGPIFLVGERSMSLTPESFRNRFRIMV
jgi:hypothetical protein